MGGTAADLANKWLTPVRNWRGRSGHFATTSVTRLLPTARLPWRGPTDAGHAVRIVDPPSDRRSRRAGTAREPFRCLPSGAGVGDGAPLRVEVGAGLVVWVGAEEDQLPGSHADP